MNVDVLHRSLRAATEAHSLTIWKWLAGGTVNKLTANALKAARERIEAEERAALTKQVEVASCPHECGEG